MRSMMMLCVAAGVAPGAAAQLQFLEIERFASTSGSAFQNDDPSDTDKAVEEDELFTLGQFDRSFLADASVPGASGRGELELRSTVTPDRIELRATLSADASRSGNNDGSGDASVGLVTQFSVNQEFVASFSASAVVDASNVGVQGSDNGFVIVTFFGVDFQNPSNILMEEFQINTVENPLVTEDDLFFVVTLQPGALYGLGVSGAAAANAQDGTGTSGSTDVELNFLFEINDEDGDGLVDAWEEDGIDVDGDGEIELNLPALGANPRRKDLFVEVDVQSGGSFSQSDLDPVIQAFANAPVSNPDGSTGITLHAEIDETGIPQRNYSVNTVTSSNTLFSQVAAQREANFGTAAQRMSTNSEKILKAKREAYRYAVAGGTFTLTTSAGASQPSGWGEIPGDDFIIATGGPTFRQGDKARTFMHELGHTLGLRHGGADNIQYKPNYYSVMNYFYQMRRPGWGSKWNNALFLDYSRAKLPTVNEAALNESIGIGSNSLTSDGKFFAYNNPSPVLPVGGPTFLGDGSPAVALDFNLDDDKEDTVSLNMNNLLGYVSAANEMLVGHDDWSNLSLPVRGGDNFGLGAVGTGLTTLTDGGAYSDVDQAISEMRVPVDVLEGPCLADVNEDGILNGADFNAWLTAFAAGDDRADQNQDGMLSGADFNQWLQNFAAGCP